MGLLSMPVQGPTWYSHWAGITSALVPEMLIPASASRISLIVSHDYHGLNSTPTAIMLLSFDREMKTVYGADTNPTKGNAIWVRREMKSVSGIWINRAKR